MSVLDEINTKWGRDDVTRAGGVGSVWGIKRDMLSQSFTTRLDQLWRGRVQIVSPLGMRQIGDAPI